METDHTTETVILLRDDEGTLVPYVIDEVFSLDDPRTDAIGDYTVLIRLDGLDPEPVIVRAMDAEIPSFVGIEDEDELERVRSEYQALVMRRGFRVI